jgi:hypothetical protein
MSDEKDTAASPDAEEAKGDETVDNLTEEERAQLAELKAKEAEELAAERAEAEQKRRDEIEERTAKNADRRLFHVLVRHMARSPRTRTLRASRAGHRRQGVILDEGTRIRKRGRGRFTPVDLTKFVQNHTRLLEYIRTGAIEVCDPRSERPIPYEGVIEMLSSVSAQVNEVLKNRERNKYRRAMELHEDAMKVFEEKTLPAYEESLKGWEARTKEAKKAGGSYNHPKPIEPAPPKEPAEPGDFAAVDFDDSGLQETPLEGSTEYNTAPPPEDVTQPDMGQGALLAAVDQHEAEAAGETSGTGLLEDTGEEAGGEETTEETTEEGGEDVSYTEEQLLDMKLVPLKELAIETYGCEAETINKMKAKKDVVAAIFENANGEE